MASFGGPGLATFLATTQIRLLRHQGREVTPEQRREIEEQARKVAQMIARCLPTDSIIPLMHVIGEGHVIEEAVNHDEARGLKVTPRMHMYARLHGWFMQKLLRFSYWQSAKDETDAVVIATSNKRSDQLDPRIHEFFEVFDMTPLSAEQRGEVLRFHAQGKHLAPTVDLGAIAQDAEAFTGDELAAIVNNAALQAATQNHQEITREDVDEAFVEQLVRKDHDQMGR